MAQLVIASAFAAVGSLFGPAGLQIGWIAGNLVGGALAPSQKVGGPPSTQLQAPRLQYGQQIPRIYAREVVGGWLAWASEYRPIATMTEQGKGGPSVDSTTYTYRSDALYILATENPILAITRIWDGGTLIYCALADADPSTFTASATTEHWDEITLFDGNPTQLPWSVYEDAVGAANAIAYRDRSTVGIANLNHYGSPSPRALKFEVITAGTVGSFGDGLLCHFDEMDGAEIVSVLGPNMTTAGSAGLASTAPTPKFGAARGEPDPSDLLSFNAVGITGASDGSWIAEGWFYVTGDESVMKLSDNVHGFHIEIGLFTEPLHDSSVIMNYATALITGGGQGGNYSERAELNQWNYIGCQFDAVAQEFSVFINGLPQYGLSGNLFPGGTFDTVNLCGATMKVDEFYFHFGRAYNYATGTPDSISIPTAPFSDANLPIWTPATVDLADVVTAECALSGFDMDRLDVSDLVGVEVTGIAAIGSARQVIEALMAGYYFDWTCSDKLYARRRGGSIVGTLSYDQLAAGVDGATDSAFDPVFGNDEEIPARVALSYVNLNADYETGTELGDRMVSVGGSTTTVTLPLVLTPTEAKGRALTMALDAKNAATTANISLTDDYSEIEPTDPILVPDRNGTVYRMRVNRETYANGVHGHELIFDDPSSLLTAGIASDERSPSITVAGPVNTQIVLLDAPIQRDADDEPGFYAAAKPMNAGSWPGTRLYKSADDLSFDAAATFTDRAVIGLASTTLANWTHGSVWDEVSTVMVDVGTGTLSSSTKSGLQANRALNAALIGADGRWEEIRFVTAALISPGVYTLSTLLRGCRGTETNMGSHTSADSFVLMQTTGLRRIAGESSELGLARYWRGITLGRNLGTASSQTFSNDGVGLKPFSPSRLRAARDGSNNATITWMRRTRLTARYGGVGGSSIPLGEASERYQVDVYEDDTFTTIVRTLLAIAQTVDYSAANQTADGLTPGDPLSVRVYQMSEVVGRGYTLKGTV